MVPYWWAVGKCRRLTALQNGSVSQVQMVRMPALRAASAKPPMPLQRAPWVRAWDMSLVALAVVAAGELLDDGAVEAPLLFGNQK